MFEGIGETFVEIIFRRILDKYGVRYIPPNVIKGVDFVLFNEVAFIELEDTAGEIYHAISQILEKVAGIASIYRGFIIIAVPVPRDPERIIAPLQRFFFKTWKFNVHRELWLISENIIIKIIISGEKLSPFLSEIAEVIEVHVEPNGKIPRDEKMSLINKLSRLLSDKIFRKRFS